MFIYFKNESIIIILILYTKQFIFVCMDSAHPTIANNFFTLKQAAEILSVPVEMLLEWNDNNILKPTITQNGEIGYTQDQINKFLAIRNILQTSNNTFGKEDIPQQSQSFILNPSKDGLHQRNDNSMKPDTSSYSPPQTSSIHGSAEKIYTESKFIKSSKKDGSFIALGIISLILIMILPLIVIFFSRQNSLKSPTNPNTTASEKETANDKTGTASKISSVNFLGSATPALQVPMENMTASVNESGSSTPEVIADNHKPVIPLSGQVSEPDIKENNILGAINVNYNAIANYASRSNFKDTETEIFDNEGNIKGNASSDLLATTLGTTGVVQSDRLLRQTMNPYMLLAFLTMGLFLVIFGYKKQLDYSVAKLNNMPVAYPDVTNNTPQQRIFEIDQKTDGTVVFYFQEVEYKVCKPELNSESDQFIERLLSFAPEDIKEINYDIMKDKKIRVNAPLSKLVTRLGFVGIKRDLFFPRTSKNRVLFRRYVTREDLDSMGLTKDNILNKLIN